MSVLLLSSCSLTGDGLKIPDSGSTDDRTLYAVDGGNNTTSNETATEGSEDNSNGSSLDEEEQIPTGTYCEFNDAELANCDPERNFDPWIAGTGEVHYWIRDGITEVFPFTTHDEPEVWYGYFQITSPETVRERTEDIFHVWFSESPNGPVLEGADCEWYTTQATGNFFWTLKMDEALTGMCYLGEHPRILYANFETRCYSGFFEGICDDENKNKSDRTYQFDVSRRFKNY